MGEDAYQSTCVQRVTVLIPYALVIYHADMTDIGVL